jgi:uncharacterized protein YciI
LLATTADRGVRRNAAGKLWRAAARGLHARPFTILWRIDKKAPLCHIHAVRSGGSWRMPHVIITKDKPNAVALRNEVRPEHLEYMTARLDKLLGAFAQVDDANTTVHGGVIVYDSDDRSEVEAFVANDPFAKAGLFESVTISRCRKAFFNYQRLI